MKKRPTKTKANTKVMYVGPSIIGVATRNTVYDEIPVSIQTAIAAAPFLAGLCISMEDSSNALAQIQKKSGAIYTLYTKALNYSATSKGEN